VRLALRDSLRQTQQPQHTASRAPTVPTDPGSATRALRKRGNRRARAEPHGSISRSDDHRREKLGRLRPSLGNRQERRGHETGVTWHKRGVDQTSHSVSRGDRIRLDDVRAALEACAWANSSAAGVICAMRPCGASRDRSRSRLSRCRDVALIFAGSGSHRSPTTISFVEGRLDHHALSAETTSRGGRRHRCRTAACAARSGGRGSHSRRQHELVRRRRGRIHALRNDALRAPCRLYFFSIGSGVPANAARGPEMVVIGAPLLLWN